MTILNKGWYNDMSIVSWFLKPKREMAKENTKYVRMGKYEISSHAQNRTADKTRSLKKSDMVQNLFGRRSENSELYEHKDGTLQYDRVNDKNRTITHIVNSNNRVRTIRRYHNNPREIRKAYKNFERRK